MPLPPEAVTISGGCNCSAIRYRVSIPCISERPIHPTFNVASGKELVRLPFVCVDHCNDCRRATGALLGVVLCSPTSYVEISLLPAPETPTNNAIPEDDQRTWVPAEEIFPPGTKSRDNTTLSFYTSSEGRTRAFCSNCGTQFGYSAYPYPKPWPRMLDIWIGSVDQKDLEKEWLVPERHLWWDVGIEWIRKFGAEGSGGVPKHGIYRVDEEVK
jgi:hypothetical protein